jgi:putative phage-type endonuclease
MALTLQQRINRKSGMGGSDAAAILGLSKWSTALDVFFDKISDEIEAVEETTPEQEWGNRLEPLILQKFRDQTGLEVLTMDKAFNIKPDENIKHKQHSWMFANVDGFIPSENAVLEIKTADSRVASDWSTEGGDNIPEYYLTQCAHYAEVLNVQKVYIAVLIGGNDYRQYHYNANPRLQNIIVEREKDFWENHVLTRLPPPAQTIEDYIKLWSKSGVGTYKTASEDIEASLYDMRILKRQIKTLEEEFDEKKKEIFDFLQDTEILLDSQSKKLASWKSQKTNRFDIDAFKKTHPDLYKQFIKISESRRFLLGSI